ncbi:MAG: hypothetical protein LDLANPLL_02934 [Turneriella sp.]|nr:hypothetical protein [Turneriella sp.]
MRYFIFVVCALIFIRCSVNLEKEIQREIDVENPYVTFSIEPGQKVRRLEKLELTFSEEVSGGAQISDYALSGDGQGTLNIVGITKESRKRILSFTGIPADGTLKLTITGIFDSVGNPLQNPEASWSADGAAKWRYLARKMSRGLIALDQLHIQKWGDDILLSYTDEQCRANYGYNDISIIAYNTISKSFRHLGVPCIVSAKEMSPSASNIIVADNQLYLAVRDTSEPGEKATVLTFTGNTWIPVGTPRFTPAAQTGASQLSYAAPNLYLTYRDSATSNRLRIYFKDLGTANDWQLLDANPISDANTFSTVPVQKYDNKLLIAMRDGTCNKPYMRYYDFGTSSYSTKLDLVADAGDTSCDGIQLIPGASMPTMQYSVKNGGDRIIRLFQWDTSTSWASTNWVPAFPAYTAGILSVNYLDCQLRGTQPFCNFNLGSGFNYTVTYTALDSWHHLVSPTKSDSAVNGSNPGFLVTDEAVYLAVRDKDAGYSDMVSLLSYE